MLEMAADQSSIIEEEQTFSPDEAGPTKKKVQSIVLVYTFLPQLLIYHTATKIIILSCEVERPLIVP